jgi:hypothetical protein
LVLLMKTVCFTILALVLILCSTCKKGFHLRNQFVKLSNDNKHWSLVKYKVNGIDSTDLINFGNYPDFKSTFFLALMSSRTSGMPSCYNRFYTLGAVFEDKYTILRVGNSKPASKASFYTLGGDTCHSSFVSDCQRNVFLPEGKDTRWKIEKFRFGKLVLTCKQNNSYYLELKANK